MIEVEDFQVFLREMGLTQARLDAAAQAMPAPIAKGRGAPYRLEPSPLHGLGCFATRRISGLIGMLKCGEQWSEAGRYINHSPAPNARAVMEQGALLAYGRIPKGAEITLDYRQVRDSLGGA